MLPTIQSSNLILVTGIIILIALLTHVMNHKFSTLTTKAYTPPSWPKKIRITRHTLCLVRRTDASLHPHATADTSQAIDLESLRDVAIHSLVSRGYWYLHRIVAHLASRNSAPHHHQDWSGVFIPIGYSRSLYRCAARNVRENHWNNGSGPKVSIC